MIASALVHTTINSKSLHFFTRLMLDASRGIRSASSVDLLKANWPMAFIRERLFQ